MLERYSAYLGGGFGILHRGQYFDLFVLSFNPAIFRLFELRHFAFLAVGILLSVFNHRAVLPFLLLILLDLDWSKCDKAMKRWIFLWFILGAGIVMLFGGGWNG